MTWARIYLSCLLFVGFGLGTVTTNAQTETPPAGPREGERLSSYLLRQPEYRDAYHMATQWITAESRSEQLRRHRLLLRTFSSIPTDRSPEKLTENQRQAWVQWLGSSRPQGRAVLPSADARWLQGNPKFDPRLSIDDEIRLPERPSYVAVVFNQGGICTVNHLPGRSAVAYARQCENLKSDSYERGYIVQPDGVIETIYVSYWHRSHQNAPAPGSWIWIPDKNMNWPESFDLLLTQFLAGQGVPQQAVPPDKAATEAAVDSSQRPAIGLIQTRDALSSQFRDLPSSANDWGVTGLMQTPSARFMEAGTGSVGFSKTRPYTRLNFTLSPFDWFEATFRYVDIANRLYGPEIAGDQSFKDKSIDAKLRLITESRFAPQLAVGFRDVGGTGLFAGEYLVASKRFGDIDASLGIGWGYLGNRRNVSNPLGGIFPSFKTRPNVTESAVSGGALNLSSFFRGPAALFGGIQYHTPWDKWSVKLEFDGNNYQHEPLNNNQSVKTPLNAGLVYQLGKYSHLTVGVERGNTVMFGLSLGGNLGQLRTPKVDDPRPVPLPAAVNVTPINEMPAKQWQELITRLEQQTYWQVGRIDQRGTSLRIVVNEAPTFSWKTAIDRANRVVHAFAPKEVRNFTYVIHEHGMPVREFVVSRQQWLISETEYTAPFSSALLLNQTEEPYLTQPVRPSVTDITHFKNSTSPFSGGFGFAYSQSFGGPDGFILFQLSADAQGEVKLSENDRIYAALQLRLLDNYKNFKYTAPSELPRVRTYIREYVTTSDLTLPRLQATHTQKISDSLSAQVYGGLLESMFAGVGGELLYRPFQSSAAFGVDVNRVRQRDFAQDFRLRDYEVTTGHATLYWRTGWRDVLAKISAGQYLAGDRGMTLDLSREFFNGVRIGAFATKTNVSAARFGEGAFDKGIYVNIPFDVMMTKSSDQWANLFWRPLTRDGGAKLNRKFPLYKEF